MTEERRKKEFVDAFVHFTRTNQNPLVAAIDHLDRCEQDEMLASLNHAPKALTLAIKAATIKSC